MGHDKDGFRGSAMLRTPPSPGKPNVPRRAKAGTRSRGTRAGRPKAGRLLDEAPRDRSSGRSARVPRDRFPATGKPQRLTQLSAVALSLSAVALTAAGACGITTPHVMTIFIAASTV